MRKLCSHISVRLNFLNWFKEPFNFRILLFSFIPLAANLNSCTKESEDEIIRDCVSEKYSKTFRFQGNHSCTHSEFEERSAGFKSYSLDFNFDKSKVDLDLNPDNTFMLRVSIACDKIPDGICDSVSRKSGMMTYDISGVWLYNQRFEIFRSNYAATEKRLRGTCLLKADRPLKGQHQTTINGKYFISCGMTLIDFRMPISPPDSLFFQFVY